jgi:hypothetical protein
VPKYLIGNYELSNGLTTEKNMGVVVTVTNFLDVLALACTNKISYRVQIAGVSGGGIGL